MSIRTRFAREDEYVAERSSPIYEVKLTDADGTVLLLAQIETLTLTLYDDMSAAQTIVNSVNAVDIKNTGRGTIDGNGLLRIQFLPNDMQIVTATHRLERRIALIQWTYGPAGIYANAHEIELYIRNLSKIG